MVAKKSEEVAEVLFANFPPAIRFIENVPVTGWFKRITMGPEHEQYGKPVIVIMQGIDGQYYDRGGETHNVEDGKEYAVWLIGEVLRNAFLELKPEPGERIAMRYDGKKASDKRQDAKGEAVIYSVYQVSCPDRPKEDQSVSWDDIK